MVRPQHDQRVVRVRTCLQPVDQPPHLSIGEMDTRQVGGDCFAPLPLVTKPCVHLCVGPSSSNRGHALQVVFSHLRQPDGGWIETLIVTAWRRPRQMGHRLAARQEKGTIVVLSKLFETIIDRLMVRHLLITNVECAPIHIPHPPSH